MLAKPIVIVAALLFSVSAQANPHSSANTTAPVVNPQVTASDDLTAKSDAKGEVEQQSVVFLAQGMSGFIAL